jgi:hypothetical protein
VISAADTAPPQKQKTPGGSTKHRGSVPSTERHAYRRGESRLSRTTNTKGNESRGRDPTGTSQPCQMSIFSTYGRVRGCVQLLTESLYHGGTIQEMAQRHLQAQERQALVAAARAYERELAAHERTTDALHQAVEAGVPVLQLVAITGIPRMTLLRRFSARGHDPWRYPMSRFDRSAELDAEIRDRLTDVRGGLTTGPTDAALELAMDEAGFPTLDELAIEAEWSES